MVVRYNYKNIRRRIINNLIGFNFFRNPYKNLKIVGVTGTSGKTTTATLLYKITTALGYKAGLLSTVENIIAGKIKPSSEKGPATSPDLSKLKKLLEEMFEKGCEYVFMEVSSIAEDQNRLAGIKFSGGIFTNLSQDHIDYHKTIKNYFLAKKKFFKRLPKDAFALSNVDDNYGVPMVENIKAKKYLYGFSDLELEFPNGKQIPDWRDFHGKILKLDIEGLELDFNGEKVKSKLLGKFNAYNLLGVWSACKLLGFDMRKVKEIIETIEPPRGRFDHFTSPDGVLAVVDYSHKPDALKNILLAIKEVKPKNSRIISVFGCGGDRDPVKRPMMGKIGASLSDVAIFTSDNPRSEDPNAIIERMKDDLTHEESVKVITILDRRLAIAEAVELSKKGDVVLVAGFGHEHYQEIKGVKNYFNDTEELQKAFLHK